MLAILKLLVMISFIFHVSPARAQEGWEKQWNQILEAGQKEGKVVVATSPDEVMREIAAKFKARYGITVEHLAGRSTETIERVRRERAAGITTVDIFMSGIENMVWELYPEKFIDPLKPLLLLPEVTDGAKWKKRKVPFVDPEERYVVQPFSSVSEMLFINTDHVKREEMRSARDLLNPKWRGKISTDDPTVTGSGLTRASIFYAQLGEDFVKQLYVDQKPVRSRDRRQYIDWLARGTYPICLNCREYDMRTLLKESFPLVEIFELSDVRTWVAPGPWNIAVANKAPHPNAAAVFANWMLTKEGLEIYSRGAGSVTVRSDVDESFLRREIIPRPGVNYFDTGDWKWTAKGRVEAKERLTKSLKVP
jgi:iron(III) transport system substrate-binding protein